MASYITPEYDPIREWIKKARNNNIPWESIEFARKANDDELGKFLNKQRDENFWPELTTDQWKEIVSLQKNAEEETIHLQDQDEAATIHDEGDDNNVTVPSSPQSSWQKYRKTLIEGKGFNKGAVTEIEHSTIRILKRLSLDTRDKDPIKGLVIGNVQSGKTANMVALMSMAADWGWNMFIVLSGTIDNLRIQTQSRMRDDLNVDGGNLSWHPIEHPKLNLTIGRAQDLDFGSRSRQRYFTVCLKNSSRLKQLIQWLQESPHTQKKMRIIVIDDEADQAGINTAKIDEEERKTINRLICNLVNGQNENGDKTASSFMAMNYIGYTATPYANILNEAGRESLYPRNFISTLSVSDEYFGPQQIFGIPGTEKQGLDIIRTITPDEVSRIKDIHDGVSNALPEELKDAICWFMCGVSCMRIWNYKKPVSMLIHTSQRTNHHGNIGDAVSLWIRGNSSDSLIGRCHKVWDSETSSFDITRFREQYPEYGIDDNKIHQYPSWSEIEIQLKLLLDSPRISPIPLGENKKATYHAGIHLCIDDCARNTPEDGMFLRLMYPDKDHMPNPAPAFIVIGGQTLSRGLTIEGLISTYFLRSVSQADTLMQMGRWFGYRKGYELLPRIWLTDKTQKQFRYLSELDQELRDEIHQMEVLGITPEKYGPRVKAAPGYIRITAKNKQQRAQPSEMDYSGTFKQTYLFDNDKDELTENLEATCSFIASLGKPETHKPCNQHSSNTVIWRGVGFSSIRQYLSSYHFQQRLRVFNDIDTLCNWVIATTKEGCLQDWNVILAGLDNANEDQKVEIAPGVKISKVIRTAKTENSVPGIINIGALRATRDIIADVDLEKASDPVKDRIKHFKLKFAKEIRNEAGMTTIPQLLIYIVDKDSKAIKGSKTRQDLNAPVDIAGICINIPGVSLNSDNVATVSVQLPEEDDAFDNDVDINGADED